MCADAQPQALATEDRPTRTPRHAITICPRSSLLLPSISQRIRRDACRGALRVVKRLWSHDSHQPQSLSGSDEESEGDPEYPSPPQARQQPSTPIRSAPLHSALLPIQRDRPTALPPTHRRTNGVRTAAWPVHGTAPTNRSHARIRGPTATFRHDPIDILRRALDVARLPTDTMKCVEVVTARRVTARRQRVRVCVCACVRVCVCACARVRVRACV